MLVVTYLSASPLNAFPFEATFSALNLSITRAKNQGITRSGFRDEKA